MLLAQLAEARGASLLSSSSSSSSLPAASLPYPQASHTHTAPTSIQYTRSQAMSVSHKYANREVYVLSGSSARKLPMVMSVKSDVVSMARVTKQRTTWRLSGASLTPRPPAVRFHNKQVQKMEITSKLNRWASIQPETVVAAKKLAAANIAAGVDRKNRAATVSAGKKSAIVKGAAHRGDSTRMAEVTAATQAAGGLKCDPPRRALGLYNLNETSPASVEELTSECEKRALSV